jgi:small subunit ribosomal protein S1
MVKQHTHNQWDKAEGPPPIDETWWEAVLAEEGDDYSRIRKPQKAPELPPPQPGPTPPADQVDDSLDWQHALKLYKEDQTINLQVTGYNKGGLLVDGEGLQGFVPISHLVEIPTDILEEEQEPFLADYLDHQLKLKVIECDQKRGRVVFSERAALADSGVRNALFGQLKAGECTEGTVTNVTDFGAFIDLGGVEGLVHVSEISWGRVRHPADVVQVGDRVPVYVIHVDPTRSRVALSIKRLCQNPWETAEERYYPGQVTEAVITSIVSYGAFARLEEGLDGLIHITEISQAIGNRDPQQTLCEGQRVRVKILHVDATKQRLGLSLYVEK